MIFHRRSRYAVPLVVRFCTYIPHPAMNDEASTTLIAFIDIGEPSALRRRRNANQARSIVMTERRRRQRLAKDKKQYHDRGTSDVRSDGPDDGLEMLYTQAQDLSSNFLLRPMDPAFSDAIWDAYLRKSLQVETLSNASLIERDIVALRGYMKPVTMHLHKLINHGTHALVEISYSFHAYRS
jgi:hypothetical protein